MNTVTKLAGLVLAGLVATTSIGQAGPTLQVEQKTRIQLAKVAGCLVAGSPSEFPDDLWFTNKGLGTLKAGTTIKWTIVGYGTKGSFTLSADLAPGKNVFASGILGGGVEAGHDCKATVA